jgi:small subunit ribosomal protein S27Ae
MSETTQETPAQTRGSSAPLKRKERPDTPIYKFYDIKGEKLTRLRKECPRCGRGVFLGEHRDRLTCGKCGYTSYKKAQR